MSFFFLLGRLKVATKYCPPLGSSGSVLLEALSGVWVCLLAFLLGLEICRRATLMVLLSHASFIAVRARAFGVTASESATLVRRYLKNSQAVPFQTGGRYPQILSLVHVSESYRAHVLKASPGRKWAQRLTLSLRVRYPLFLSFSLGKDRHHHAEITQTCPFWF